MYSVFKILKSQLLLSGKHWTPVFSFMSKMQPDAAAEYNLSIRQLPLYIIPGLGFALQGIIITLYLT